MSYAIIRATAGQILVPSENGRHSVDINWLSSLQTLEAALIYPSQESSESSDLFPSLLLFLSFSLNQSLIMTYMFQLVVFSKYSSLILFFIVATE